jgi:uncharacterized protein (TIGR00255 family)
MTGHGQASSRHGEVAIDVEIRTVNNRFLKVSAKVSDYASSIEPQLESIVRDYLKRGSVTISVRISHVGRNNAATVNQQTLESYLTQSQSVASKLGITLQYQLGDLLMLPGVLETTKESEDDALLDSVRQTVKDALDDLQSMRKKEGAAMAAQFIASLNQIDVHKQSIESRAPLVVAEYRTKLEQRLRTSLATLGHETTEIDLLRETLIHADRCDISEEITRLNSHLAQFRDLIGTEESQGRRLDFLIQELFRETNTIGSKANDSQISQWVVSIKTTIEQIRELVQNVE